MSICFQEVGYKEEKSPSTSLQMEHPFPLAVLMPHIDMGNSASGTSLVGCVWTTSKLLLPSLQVIMLEGVTRVSVAWF